MNTELQTVRGLKRPWLAALLNLIPLLGLLASFFVPFISCITTFLWGLGYLYLGRWIRFVIALIAPWVIGVVVLFVLYFLSLGEPTPENLLPVFLLLGLIEISLQVFTAVDAWRLAKQHNARLLAKGAVREHEGEVEEEGEREEPAMPQDWEWEIASDLSFHDRVTPDMLSHVPQDRRVFALQEYARLHPDEAYWDGEALVWKGKTKAGDDRGG